MASSAQSTLDKLLDNQLISKTISRTLSFEDYIIATKHDAQYAFDDMVKVKEHLASRDAQGQTLLHHAVKCHSNSLVLKLIYCGFDVNTEDASGNTPLDLALSTDTPNPAIVTLFRQYDAVPKTKSVEFKKWFEAVETNLKLQLKQAPTIELVKAKNTLDNNEAYEKLKAEAFTKDSITPYQRWLNLNSAYEIFYKIFTGKSYILEELEARKAKAALPVTDECIKASDIIQSIEASIAEYERRRLESEKVSPPILTKFKDQASPAADSKSTKEKDKIKKDPLPKEASEEVILGKFKESLQVLGEHYQVALNEFNRPDLFKSNDPLDDVGILTSAVDNYNEHLEYHKKTFNDAILKGIDPFIIDCARIEISNMDSLMKNIRQFANQMGETYKSIEDLNKKMKVGTRMGK